MTWSIESSRIDMRPVVKWDGKRLCHLTTAQFETAVRAADALGDDVVKQVERNPHGGGVSMAEEADTIVIAVMREMERRSVDSVGGPANDDEPEGDAA